MSGEVEVVSDWDAAHPFDVMHWGRYKDSGWVVRSFVKRETAVTFALAYARTHGCDMHSADIVYLSEVRA